MCLSGVAAFVLSLRLIPESQERGRGTQLRRRRRDHRHGRADGARLRDREGAAARLDVCAYARHLRHGVLLLGSFIAIELRAAVAARAAQRSSASARLSVANIVMFLVASGLFAMFFFNSLYIQRVLPTARSRPGSRSCRSRSGIIVSAGLASALAPKIGVRPVAVVGMIVTAAGLLLLTQIPVHGTYLADVLPADPAHVARHGRRVRAADARRDDRARGLRPGPCLGPVQHLAADRRRARARSSRHDRGQQAARTPSRGGGPARRSCTASTGRSAAAPSSSSPRSSCCRVAAARARRADPGRRRPGLVQ